MKSDVIKMSDVAKTAHVESCWGHVASGARVLCLGSMKVVQKVNVKLLG